MTKEFKIKTNSEQETVYTLESASSGGTSSGSIASTSNPIGGMQRRASLVTSEELDNPTDTVTMDVPLLMRIMEYSREDAKTDMDLHNVVENLIELGSSGKTLSMQHYDQVVSNNDQSVSEKAPKGWEPTVKAMKKHKEIDNPFALAHWMKGKGYKSHKTESHGDVGQGWGKESYATYAGTRHGRGVAEDSDDWVYFNLSNEPAYNAVMTKFGDYIEWHDDTMKAPKEYWSGIEQTAFDAGGEAEEDYMGTGVGDVYMESLAAQLESTIEGSNAEYDDEAGMAQGNLHTIARAAQGLLDTINDNENLPEWAQEKIAKVEGMLVAVWDYLISQEEQGVDPRVNESAAWQRKSGKSKTGGLNAKGVASYRRENPGSKLQTAVTTKPSKLKPGSKDAKRRKSFCARMGGSKGPMKDEHGKPTRKALALRKWNCESVDQSIQLLNSVKQDLVEMKQRLDPKCWKGKHKEGTKIKGGIRVNNCVPNESSDPYIESLSAKLNEKIPKGASAEYYIKDFEKSNAPQFRGKSKEKRKQMALAAFRDSQTKK